ncbi:MAG: cysteine desulfurase family protein [Bacteroidota bacterium]|nr:cysteine desulfurase family protein [Bacteroidota bacterium]MDP4229619.1 cysteine desulfurase family protein [Bacteroidota bacterium]MDP4235854.1 cysteine desulfurase family protein [Bacteroidota bacterium]
MTSGTFPSRMIYLDNSATTPLDPLVAEAMKPYLGEKFGNASSIHSLGREARLALEDSRNSIASAIGADPAEIVFTSGGTEANNHAIKGSIFAAVKSGKHFDELSAITSEAEHYAILEPMDFLESLGVKILRSKVGGDGVVEVEGIASQFGKDLTFASFMLVNNEVGSINPVKGLAGRVRSASPNAIIHTDAVQGLGRMDIDVKELGVDLLSLSAHKIHGPKGIGALFIRRGVKLEPLLHGGSQERNRRGGTESVALAVGFGEAVRQMESAKQASREQVRMVQEYAIKRLAALPEVSFNSPKDGVDGILNISFTADVLKRLDSEALLIRFDMEGIAVSNGAACTSGSLQPSHVLAAMGKGNEIASKSVRVSFSHLNRTEEIDRFIEVLQKIIRD